MIVYLWALRYHSGWGDQLANTAQHGHRAGRPLGVYKLREKAFKLRCSVEIITKSRCCLCFGVCILVRFCITVKCLVKNSTTCQTTYSAQSAIIKIIGIFTFVV